MAREIRVTCGLGVTVRSGSLVTLDYQSRPQSFQDDLLAGVGKGPTPGAITVPTAGVDVDLSQLSSPGWCRLANLSDEFTVEYGIHDGAVFHPFGELPPGTSTVFKFSTNFGEEHADAGTGTTGDVNMFHMKSYGGAASALVEAFER